MISTIYNANSSIEKIAFVIARPWFQDNIILDFEVSDMILTL